MINFPIIQFTVACQRQFKGKIDFSFFFLNKKVMIGKAVVPIGKWQLPDLFDILPPLDWIPL